MKIERPKLDDSLLAFARGGHGLILGAPGAGKTYSLRTLATKAEEAGLLYLWLSVDTLGDVTEEDLRIALGYEGSFQDAIKQLFSAGIDGGLIIIDGLDAARNATARARLIERIRQLLDYSPTNWHALVSVRNYDASKSPRLLSLFGPATKTSDSAFVSPLVQTRHFTVPELSEEEVLSAVTQIPGLTPIYQGGRPDFKRLLRSPFNLWLLERIIARTADPGTLGGLASEVQLLDRFWSLNVSRQPDDAARRAILLRVTAAMMAARNLAVRKTLAYDPVADAAWHGLLSDDILAEIDPSGERIGFRHNILFDYAVAVLQIDPDSVSVATFIRADTSRPLFLRPSLLYFFARLWYFDRNDFWRCFWGLLPAEDPGTRLVARLIPPFIVASEANVLEDFVPLTKHVRNQKEPGGTAITRVLYALRYAGHQTPTLWAAFADSLRADLAPSFAWELGSLVQRLAESGEPEQITLLHSGSFGRALLDFALTNRTASQNGLWFDNLGSMVALPIVAQTIGTNLGSSRELVLRVLALLEEDSFPIRYFYSLADKIEHFFGPAPDLARRIYLTIFGHDETRSDVTHMGGIVIPMTSTRRQDFEMCHYGLAKSFGKFLKAVPHEAIPVAILVLNDQAIRSLREYLREGSSLETLYAAFSFLGKERQYLPDHLFLKHLGRQDYVSEMVDTLQEFLSSEDPGVEPLTTISLLSDHALTSSAWGVALHIGAASPVRYAAILHELVLAAPIMLSDDLQDALATFLQAAYPVWSTDKRETFEKTVMSLSSVKDSGWSAKRLKRRIDWIVTRLDQTELATPWARRRARYALARGQSPMETSSTRIEVTSRAFSEDDWLSERGIRIDLPENSRLRGARDRLVPFWDKWANGTPDADSVAAILPTVAEVHESLLDTGSADSEIVESTWTKLAAAAQAILRTEPDPTTNAFALCRQIIVSAATFPPPAVSDTRDQEYTWAHWSPTPRIEAIQGVSYLLRIQDDEALRTMVLGFASSREPSERLLAARYAPMYLGRAPDLYWRVMEMVSTNESNPVVASGALSALSYPGASGDDKRLPLIRTLVDRFLATEDRDLNRRLADWATYFALYREDEWAIQRMEAIVQRLPQSEDLVLDLVSYAVLSIAPAQLKTAEGKRVSERAAAWLVALLGRLPDMIQLEGSSPSDQARGAFRAAHKIVNGVVSGVHLNLHRAREETRGEADADSTNASGTPGLESYYTAAKPIFDALLAFSSSAQARGMAAPSAYHLMETLVELLPVAPVEIVSTAAAVAVVAKSGNYHLDSLAVREMVRLVETVLADYREFFTDGKGLADILVLLDVFAEAGWSEAMALVWRLDEVFR